MIALALGAALLLGACGGDDDAAAPDGDRLVVVTTVAPITSIAADVIGDLADIRGVVPEGTNSHTFEPTPSVSEVLEDADVVFANGLQLEEPTLALARDVAGDATDRRAGRPHRQPRRVPLRLLLPGGRGQAQPPPLDRSGDGEGVRASTSPRP